VRFALIDKDTISVIKTALQDVDSKVELLSLGSEPLKGTTHISELLKDDGKGAKIKLFCWTLKIFVLQPS